MKISSFFFVKNRNLEIACFDANPRCGKKLVCQIANGTPHIEESRKTVGISKKIC
jgi:hypothetical protein